MDGPGVVVVGAQGDHESVRSGVRAGDEKGKGRILDDLVTVTGWSRAMDDLQLLRGMRSDIGSAPQTTLATRPKKLWPRLTPLPPAA